MLSQKSINPCFEDRNAKLAFKIGEEQKVQKRRGHKSTSINMRIVNMREGTTIGPTGVVPLANHLEQTSRARDAASRAQARRSSQLRLRGQESRLRRVESRASQ